jgi:DNA end-binding protein Ku
MAPRSIWNGTITFGLVNVPVKVYSATESKSVHFHHVHLEDGARIEHRRVCPKEDKEVPNDEIVKGYELSGGGFVELTKDEIAAAAGENAKLIDVEHFVAGEEIDPAFYEKTYYLGAGEKGEDAYRLLRAALEKSGRVGIGRWVFHDRERLVAVRPLDGILGLHTMNFHDEIVEPDELDLPSPQRNPSKREIEMAGKLVESLAAKFEPHKYRDTYRDAVLKVIKRKAKGEEIEPPEEPERDDDKDLAAALEASL